MKCHFCSNTVRNNQKLCVCDLCGKQCHEVCYMSNSSLHVSPKSWICPQCISNELPFNHIIEDDDFHRELFSFFHYSSNDFSSELGLDSHVFDVFGLNNDEKTPIRNLNSPCNYYFNDTFNHKFAKYQNNDVFSLFHLNAQSLSAKHDCVADYLSSLCHKFSIYAFTETWFNSNVSSLYNMPGYSFVHRSRKGRRGGGVCLYVDSKYAFKERDDLVFSNDSTDTLFIEIEMKHEKNIILGVVYRAPNSNACDFNSMLETCLKAIAMENKICYIVGDFNFDILKHSISSCTNNFISLMYSHGLYPLVTKPTRVTSRSYTCIDNIFTNIVDKPTTPGILFSDVSDHLPIFQFTAFDKKHFPQYSIECYDGKLLDDNVNIKELIRDLCSVNWSSVENCSDVNSSYDTFIETFSKICEKHTTKSFPPKKSKKVTIKKPWVTKGILKSINRKQKLYYKHIHVPSRKNEQAYKRFRNKLNVVLRESKRQYLANLIERNRSSLCKTWKIVNEILGRSYTSKLPTFIELKDKKLEDHKEIANAFNHYFSNIGVSISKNIHGSSKHFTDFLSSKTSASAFFDPTSESEIVEIVKEMKCKTSCGHDGLSSKFIKQIIHYIARPLSFVFNQSLCSGKVPAPLKLAKVIPVYKKNNKHLIENYRPISLLPIFSKIIERIVYKRLYNYLSENDLLIKEQFGFRPSFSTEAALLHTLEQIISSIERKEIPLAIYIDLSKAFDSLDHNILLRKLEHYGIRGVPHDWFIDYLSGRQQYTSFNGTRSDIMPVSCGVPQGSILGPLLFLIYVNDVINSSKCFRFIMYADDINIIFSHPDQKMLNLVVNEEVQSLCDWFKANKLQMNIGKTKYMIFQSSKKQICYPNLSIKMENVEIDRVATTNFLGVHIDEKLSWNNQVNHVHGKISVALGMMFKLRSLIPKKTLLMLYNAFILPYLDYCNLVWSGTSQRQLDRLTILQKKAIRLCTNSLKQAHTPPLFKELQTLSFRDRISFKLGIFMYKYVRSVLPDIFNDYFLSHSTKHSFNTRNKQHYILPLYRLKISQSNSVKYKGAKLWNLLSRKLKTVNTLNLFMAKYKQNILNLY